MESLTLPSLLVSLIAILWCLLYWRPYRRLWLLAGKMPGPRGYPVIGSALLFVGKLTETIPAVMKLFAEYGPLVRLWLGPRVLLLISDPDDIRVIQGNIKIINREKAITNAISPFFGNGLLTLRGERWKVHRRLLTPAFHFKILENFVEVFGKKSKIFVEKLETFGGKSFNVLNPLLLLTLDCICETTIGTAINSQEKGQNDFVDSFQEIEKLIHRCVCHPWLWIQSIYALSPTCRQSQPLIETIHAFSKDVVAQKIDEFRRGIRSMGIKTSGEKRVSSYLDMMIEASETQGSILSDEEIGDEVTTLASAGVETTANALGYCMVLIAIHSEIQAELHREMDVVFGSDGRAATPEDLKQLHVLEPCIKRVLMFVNVRRSRPSSTERWTWCLVLTTARRPRRI